MVMKSSTNAQCSSTKEGVGRGGLKGRTDDTDRQTGDRQRGGGRRRVKETGDMSYRRSERSSISWQPEWRVPSGL